MLNKVILIGNMTRDVELRTTTSGFKIATIGLAINRRFKKQDGSLGDEVCYVDVKLLGRTAEVAAQYTHKGSKVCIEGRLVLEQWNDQSGAKRSKLLVQAENFQMLDSKGSSQGSGGGYASGAGQNSYGGSQGAQNYGRAEPYQEEKLKEINVNDDLNNDMEDIPF